MEDLTKKQFRKKYKPKFLRIKHILQLESNNIKMESIIDEKNINLDILTKDKLLDMLKVNTRDFELVKKSSKAFHYLIIAITCVFLWPFFLILGSVFDNLYLTSIGLIFLFSLPFFLIKALIINSFYPPDCYWNNRDFLVENKNIFIQEVKNFPLTIILLYFPQYKKDLYLASKLRIISKYEDTPRNRRLFLPWKNIRTATEFITFVNKFCNYALDKYYKNE